MDLHVVRSSPLFDWPVLFTFLHGLPIPWVLDGVIGGATPALSPVRRAMGEGSYYEPVSVPFTSHSGSRGPWVTTRDGRRTYMVHRYESMRGSSVIDHFSTMVFSASSSACGIPCVDLRCRRDCGPSTVGCVCSVPVQLPFPLRSAFLGPP